jgi:predicted RNA-binding protein
MPNNFAKDATELYYKINKTNKNFQFRDALKELSRRRKKDMLKSTKTMKNVEKDTVDTLENATTGVVDTVSDLNPMKSVSHKKNRSRKGKGKSRRPRHPGTRRY